MVTDLKDDIRPILRERLQAVEAELLGLPERQRKLEALRDSLRAMINSEDNLRRSDELDEGAVPAFHPTRDKRTLADLVLDVLGTGPKTLDQLKEIGADWAPVRTTSYPGRAINFALVGLQKGGYVRLEDGKWKLNRNKSRE